MRGFGRPPLFAGTIEAIWLPRAEKHGMSAYELQRLQRIMIGAAILIIFGVTKVLRKAF